MNLANTTKRCSSILDDVMIILIFVLLYVLFFRLQRVEALALLCDAHLTENFEMGQSTANIDLMEQLREVTE